jgi:hypothetical protein
VKHIKYLIDEGYLIISIAEMYGVTHQCISLINKGKTWKDVHYEEDDFR